MADPEMDNLCRFATRPLAFIARYLRQQPILQLAFVTGVTPSAACSAASN